MRYIHATKIYTCKYRNYLVVHTATDSGFGTQQKKVFLSSSKGGVNKSFLE